MVLVSGLPAPFQLDPEQASLLDEFMEWRRQQRLKKQAQSNGDASDVRAKVLEDDVQSLQVTPPFMRTTVDASLSNTNLLDLGLTDVPKDTESR